MFSCICHILIMNQQKALFISHQLIESIKLVIAGCNRLCTFLKRRETKCFIARTTCTVPRNMRLCIGVDTNIKPVHWVMPVFDANTTQKKFGHKVLSKPKKSNNNQSSVVWIHQNSLKNYCTFGACLSTFVGCSYAMQQSFLIFKDK